MFVCKMVAQSAHNLSQLKVISNYWYLKVNFLVTENLLWDISSLKHPELKISREKENIQTIFFDILYFCSYKTEFIPPKTIPEI